MSTKIRAEIHSPNDEEVPSAAVRINDVTLLLNSDELSYLIEELRLVENDLWVAKMAALVDRF